jgi:threonylcarbamoyladenosine tRNA methylthiotransferase MtaB
VIRTAHRQYPNARIIVTGCYAQLQPHALRAIEGVDLVLGTEQKKDLVQFLEQIWSTDAHEGEQIITSSLQDIRTFLPACSKGNRTRYFLKVQDGCDYYCTYCTIPLARGNSRNATIADLVSQSQQVAEEGGKEIVITGVNIGDFGKSTGETFLDLLRALDEVEGIERYRISSIEPNLLTDEIIDFVASSKRIMPHFHIPLQSGSEAMLQLMHRRYDTALFASRIKHIRNRMPSAFIGIDVIVGMRGETNELFEETYRFLQSIDFTQLHVFSYSERPGTQALKITPVVPFTVAHHRSQRLLDLSADRLFAFYKRHIGHAVNVLWEHSSSESLTMQGFTENYVRVEQPSVPEFDNRITSLTLSSFNTNKTALVSTP